MMKRTMISVVLALMVATWAWVSASAWVLNKALAGLVPAKDLAGE